MAKKWRAEDCDVISEYNNWSRRVEYRLNAALLILMLICMGLVVFSVYGLYIVTH